MSQSLSLNKLERLDVLINLFVKNVVVDFEVILHKLLKYFLTCYVV